MVNFAKLVAPTVAGLPNHLKNIEEKVSKNIQDIQDLNNRIVSLESEKLNNIDSACAEFAERERRSKNIILHGLEESTSSTPIKDDIKKVLDIFNNLKSSNIKINTSNIKVFRIGNKSSDNSPRSVCINLHNKSDVMKLIVNKDKFKPYKISTDKTAYQRTQLKKLILEKEEHNSSNPNNQLQIKYFSGIPKLVNCTNSNSNNNNNEETNLNNTVNADSQKN